MLTLFFGTGDSRFRILYRILKKNEKRGELDILRLLKVLSLLLWHFLTLFQKTETPPCQGKKRLTKTPHN